MRPVPLLLSATLLLLGGACYYPAFRETRKVGKPAVAGIEHSFHVPAAGDEDLAGLEVIPLLRLHGDGYDRGYQYGRTMAPSWHHVTRRMEEVAVGLVKNYVLIEPLAKGLVRGATSHVIGRVTGGDECEARRRLPDEYRAYVRGIADGARIDVAAVERMIAFVMLSDASCSAFIACGPATRDGRLIQMRNLDWGEDVLRAQEHTVLLVHEPPGGIRYLSIGFVGLVGSISGINEAGISLSEIGAESSDRTQRGMPMPILLEEVLAKAHTLAEAVAILREAPGTGGYNYMVGSARERQGAVVEKTAHHTTVFEISQHNYCDNPYFHGFAGFDCRADTAADPVIRRYQRCSRGRDGTPLGRSAYEKRYLRQVEVFESFGRVLDIDRAAHLAEEVAAPSNIHSILYDFERGRVFLRNRAWFADDRTPESREEKVRIRAAAQPPVVIDLDVIFP